MKNIHVLARDKPSRLCLDSKEVLWFAPRGGYSTADGKQHIYITNSEEIKEGDWMYYKHFGEDIICKYDTLGSQNTNVNEHKDYYKKIILTTDQDLIKDGIQAIDDEFLEWFVKNPTCEEVEVESWQTKGEWKLDYEIIIPSEEPKTHPKVFSENGNELFFNEEGYLIKEEPKQETLEEFISEVTKNFGNEMSIKFTSGGIKLGAKWQSEKMYSEKEVEGIIASLLHTPKLVEEGSWEDIAKWLEQFKKK
jgi:hypothetical protein